MIYLLYGLEPFLISNEVKKIIKSFDQNSIQKYDLNDTLIEDIIDDASMMDLFSDNKVIIIENSTIFAGSKTPLEHNLNKFLDYLNSPNENTTLIFTLIGDKLDERKKIVKTIEQKYKVINFNNLNINNIIKDIFEDYKISNQDILLLTNRVGNDLNILYQEIEKIKIYKDKDLNITSQDIINLTPKNVSNDLFKLVDCIILKQKHDALDIYSQMLKLNEEPIKIIITLANQIRLMYQVKELSLKGYTEKDIASMLKIHPYRVKLAREKGYQYDSPKLLKLLYELAELDINIKKGLVDKNIALEIFILKLH